MKNTRTALQVLNELYPVNLPSPRFSSAQFDMEKHSHTTVEEDLQVHPKPPLQTTTATTILTYVGPLLCVIYITLLGWMYGCPVNVDNLTALGELFEAEPKNVLAAALLLSSAGLITLGIGFLWTDELEEDNLRT